MKRPHCHITVERVVVRGAARVDAGELRALIVDAVTRELSRAPLPTGRVMRASIQADAASVASGGPGLARAVAGGVARAIGGGPKHG
jgi:hypothetical protein